MEVITMYYVKNKQTQSIVSTGYEYEEDAERAIEVYTEMTIGITLAKAFKSKEYKVISK